MSILYRSDEARGQAWASYFADHAPDLVQEEGAYSATTRAAPPKPVGGSYTVVWRKVGPDWLMASDIIR